MNQEIDGHPEAEPRASAGNLQAYEIFVVTQGQIEALAGQRDRAFIAEAPVALVFCTRAFSRVRPAWLNAVLC
jgi:hypothetical protein